jgi:hypothetical protein
MLYFNKLAASLIMIESVRFLNSIVFMATTMKRSGKNTCQHSILSSIIFEGIKKKAPAATVRNLNSFFVYRLIFFQVTVVCLQNSPGTCVFLLCATQAALRIRLGKVQSFRECRCFSREAVVRSVHLDILTERMFDIFQEKQRDLRHLRHLHGAGLHHDASGEHILRSQQVPQEQNAQAQTIQVDQSQTLDEEDLSSFHAQNYSFEKNYSDEPYSRRKHQAQIASRSSF